MLRSQTDARAQVAFEFVVLIAIAFAAFIVFTAFVRDNFSYVQDETDYFKLKDVALSVKSELTLAVALEDGYQRSFFIPLTIDGLEYNITKESGFITFSSANSEYTVNVPPYSGDLAKGNNYLRKIDGEIEVNS
ncbi:hypothetical protein KY362_00465 [Candidatus Woesearchaeota archaeon]|nr:hypothetical protein [Candidatus Woesearchaeota archaeon]